MSLLQTKENEDNENNAVKKLARFWNCDFIPTKLTDPFDFVMIKPSGEYLFVEVKTRTNKKEEYATYMIGMRKILQNIAMSDAAGVPFFLCVQWSDGLGVIEPKKHLQKFELERGGCISNGVRHFEPCYFMPHRDFQVIGE